jgi:ABC-type multidrug transport system fused ATPase/permease subunit
MSPSFTRTLRSLNHDRARGWGRFRTLFEALLGIAWATWFVYGLVSIYEVSHTARLEADHASQEHALLATRDISHQHASRTTPVLEHVELNIFRGDRLPVERRSGAGKSSLGIILSGIVEPSSGMLIYRGIDIRSWGRDVVQKRVVFR